eukprot:Blabericola_migrator_1__13536@NODE_98_length_14373_cov_122_493220_g88_i0_p6_GENE_NODE_98_length_14373_cov_122_493220_g88_i0NODE_98_length_14373_cov_122_493220_g88_i0_p6_ORF_typecomplete_len216_score45_44CCCAP/PF15964_5/0_0038Pterin_bind/PF00809_22/0_011Pterin_bind/PF00809_22/5_9e02KASH_CCD/PF14662_6/0_023KASH_CCD/PF14662_6/4_8e02Leu_zip/PF15294_6/0_027Yuri_gagarin/PF15934_5/0_063ATPsynt_B/PF00430_18/1_2e03ATPsynt_B/PF00430_18/0_042HMMR_C/PF15908_5/45HMMR_C/PF15908_5/0_48DUF4407/PF14362_6/0_27Tro
MSDTTIADHPHYTESFTEIRHHVFGLVSLVERETDTSRQPEEEVVARLRCRIDELERSNVDKDEMIAALQVSEIELNVSNIKLRREIQSLEEKLNKWQAAYGRKCVEILALERDCEAHERLLVKYAALALAQKDIALPERWNDVSSNYDETQTTLAEVWVELDEYKARLRRAEAERDRSMAMSNVHRFILQSLASAYGRTLSELDRLKSGSFTSR